MIQSTDQTNGKANWVIKDWYYLKVYSQSSFDY